MRTLGFGPTMINVKFPVSSKHIMQCNCLLMAYNMYCVLIVTLLVLLPNPLSFWGWLCWDHLQPGSLPALPLWLTLPLTTGIYMNIYELLRLFSCNYHMEIWILIEISLIHSRSKGRTFEEFGRNCHIFLHGNVGLLLKSLCLYTIIKGRTDLWLGLFIV